MRYMLELTINIYLTPEPREKEIEIPLRIELGEYGRIGKSICEYRTTENGLELKPLRMQLLITDFNLGTQIIRNFLSKRGLLEKSRLKFVRHNYNLLKEGWE